MIKMCHPKKLSVLLLLCALGIQMQGQDRLSRYVFHGTPKVRGGMSNAYYSAYSILMMATMGADFLEVRTIVEDHPVLRWLVPRMEFDIHTPAWSVADDAGDVELGKPLWWSALYPDLTRNHNYLIGYEVSCKWLAYPVGAYAGLEYEWRQVRIMDGLWAGKHRTQAIVPSLGARLRLLGVGFEMTHHWNMVLDVGTSYSIAVKYKNAYGGNADAAGNGFRPRIGLMLSTLYYGTFYVQFEKDCYDFFDHKYTEPGTLLPTNELTNKFSSLVVGWTLLI